MDLVITVSQHSRKGFGYTYKQIHPQTQQIMKQLKLEKPIQVIFEGINTDIYHVIKKEQLHTDITKTLDSISEDYLFLYTGA